MTMQIRGDQENVHLVTTLAALLDALQSVARNDAEVAAVLLCMLAEGRLHVLSEVACAA
jgi:hypothetical protein